MVNSESLQTAPKSHGIMQSNIKLTPLGVFAILLAIGLLDELLIGYLSGYWRSIPGIVGVIDDYPHWIVAFLFQPAICAFLVWVLPATQRVYDQIGEKAIPEEHILEYRQFQLSFSQKINSRLIPLFCLVLGIALVVLAHIFTAQYKPVPWSYYLKWHRYSIWSLRLLIAGFCTAASVLYSVLVMINLNTVFKRYGVRLHLYHSDNAAGLKFIGDFALKLNRLALIAICFLVSDFLLAIQVGQGIAGQVNLILEFIALPIIILFSFIAPLVSCHKAMKEAKDAEINQNAAQIEANLRELHKAQHVNKEQIESITSSINLRDRMKTDIPTLPIDMSTWRAFGVNLFASLLPAIISVILEIIKPAELFKPH